MWEGKPVVEGSCQDSSWRSYQGHVHFLGNLIMFVVALALFTDLPYYQTSSAHYSLQCRLYTIVSKIKIVQTNVLPVLPHLEEGEIFAF